MKLEAMLETRKSKEGKEYEVISIKLSEHSEKLVFLTPAEKELLKLHYKNNEDTKMPEWL